ncbi:MAG: hypothetical protein PVS2B2_21980 [Candidatus Acidiferrum sp.]
MGLKPYPEDTTGQLHQHPKVADCAQCPPTQSGKNLNRKVDCARLVPFQAIKEVAFSLRDPNEVAPFHAAETRAYPPALTIKGKGGGFFVMDSACTFGNSHANSVPLRI